MNECWRTRNPEIDWVKRWNRQRAFDTPFGPMEITRRVIKHDADRIWFDTHFNFSDGNFVSHSELRFWTQDQVNALVEKAGLSVTGFYDDWEHGSFDEAISKEMIFEVKIGKTSD